MQPKKYSMTWHTYSEHLRDMLMEIMNDDYTDVTLVSEDKKHIRAHKNILSACSPVFKDIMKLEQSNKPIIYLRGIKISEIESIMQFIYLGEATLYHDRMEEFLAVARSLEIKELCNAETETNGDKEHLLKDPVTYNDSSEEQKKKCLNLTDHAPNNDEAKVKVNSNYECEHCHMIYASQGALFTHRNFWNGLS